MKIKNTQEGINICNEILTFLLSKESGPTLRIARLNEEEDAIEIDKTKEHGDLKLGKFIIGYIKRDGVAGVFLENKNRTIQFYIKKTNDNGTVIEIP